MFSSWRRRKTWEKQPTNQLLSYCLQLFFSLRTDNRHWKAGSPSVLLVVLLFFSFFLHTMYSPFLPSSLLWTFGTKHMPMCCTKFHCQRLKTAPLWVGKSHSFASIVPVGSVSQTEWLYIQKYVLLKHFKYYYVRIHATYFSCSITSQAPLPHPVSPLGHFGFISKQVAR